MIDHPAAVDVAHPRVHVPVPVVDGRDLQPHVGLDQSRHVLQRDAEVRVGVHGAVLRRVAGLLELASSSRSRRAPPSAGAASAFGAPACTPRSAASQSSRCSSSHAASSPNAVHRSHRELGTRARGTAAPACCCRAGRPGTACPGPAGRASGRSIRVRIELPGAARSISSIASKCDRFGSASRPRARTPSVPASHSGIEAAPSPGASRRSGRAGSARSPGSRRSDATSGSRGRRPGRWPAARRSRRAATARRARRRRTGAAANASRVARPSVDQAPERAGRGREA